MAGISEQLKELTLAEVVETGRVLGVGAYGEVVEVRLCGLKCAGKKLHEVFFQQSPRSEQQAIVSRFVDECLSLSKLRHPNVVQLLGVHFLGGGERLPMMVTELFPASLARCLQKHQRIPDCLKASILYDVSIAMQYLHTRSPPVVHRDLTANNVLLTSGMNAKVADVGVAKIVSLNPALTIARMAQCPETLSCIPPEALSDKPQYDQTLDVFCFGNLVLHVSTQQWPIPTALLAYDPSSPQVPRPLTEIQRRQKYLDLVDEKNPLKDIALRCLQNFPDQRPSMADTASELEKIHQSDAASLPAYLEIYSESLTLKENERDLMLRVEHLDEEIIQLRCQVEKKDEIHAEKQRLAEETEQLHHQVKVLQQEAQEKDRIIAELRKEKQWQKEGPPEYSVQKEEIQPLLSQKLRQGDQWYLVDQKWLEQWKKYVGFDAWEQYFVGKDSANPGPVDNSNLFKAASGDVLKDHLTEELDYALLPQLAWDKLSKWYGLSDGSRPIIRNVVEYGMYVKHLKVEVYLIELRLCIHPHNEVTTIHCFSRGDQIKHLQEEMCRLFELPEDQECRLWQRYMTNAYELLSKPEQTLSDASIYDRQLIMLEKKSADGSWPRDQSSTTGTSKGRGVGGASSYGSYSSPYGSYYEKGEPTTPGLCGLTNLGNTCFMNSALQCLSNTQPLTEYFIGWEKEGEKPYKKHINRDNPSGMGGALADTYGQLLEEIWRGGASYLAPRQFKTMIGRHAPQFSGYQQQDSQELVAFLLDRLHEDLNLVKKKPHVNMDVQTQGREDKDVAEETWYKHQLCNQSAIVRLFQGLQKSTLVCPECNTTSVIFKPFMYLPLPLPTNSRDLVIFVIRANPNVPVIKVRVAVLKSGSVFQLKEAVQKLLQIDPTKLVAINVYHSRFHRVYYDKDPVSNISDRDDIYLYELIYPLGHQDWTPVPVYHREIREPQDYSYSNKSGYGSVFGLPLVISVPRKGCSYQMLRGCILKQCQRYVKMPPGHPWNKELQKQLSEEEAALSEKETDEDLENKSAKKKSEDRNHASENKNWSSDESEKWPPSRNEEWDDQDVEDLFSLLAVNSYGSQEVKRFVNDGSLLQLNSQTYVSCDWTTEMALAYYDTAVAEEVVSHESCEGRKLVSIYDCVDLYAGKEILSKKDAWYCPHCKRRVKASKKFDLWKMPEILVIFFKRFSYTRYSRNKLEMHIDFPVDGLDLSKYIINQDDPQPLYDLFAISNHLGSLGFGEHYTAYAKNKETGKWYNFDDSRVQEVKNVDDLVSSAAYMLFYRRQTEGRRVPPQLNCSLNVSYAEEMRERGKEFRGGALGERQ